jgi:hypothetical protein
MKKQVFYLRDEPEFINLFDNEYEPLVWVFRWNNLTAYSRELRELIEIFYTEN